MSSIHELVTVKRSARAKRLALRLDPKERVINLVVPARMSLQKAYFFAKTHEDWVRETLGKLAPPRPFSHGAILPIFGDSIMLDVMVDPAISRTKIEMDGDVMRIKTYQDDPQNRIVAYIKKLARDGLADMASEKAQQIGKSVNAITVRDTKSRWGSCAQDGSISFSWRLVFAPYVAIDYVVAHEVAHLVHMDHGKKFWDLCRSLSIDYVEGKYWMQNHGNELMRYGKLR